MVKTDFKITLTDVTCHQRNVEIFTENLIQAYYPAVHFDIIFGIAYTEAEMTMQCGSKVTYNIMRVNLRIFFLKISQFIFH